jgi:hypothetical protein
MLSVSFICLDLSATPFWAGIAGRTGTVFPGGQLSAELLRPVPIPVVVVTQQEEE